MLESLKLLICFSSVDQSYLCLELGELSLSLSENVFSFFSWRCLPSAENFRRLFVSGNRLPVDIPPPLTVSRYQSHLVVS